MGACGCCEACASGRAYDCLRPHALSPAEARGSILQRIAPLVDKARQVAVDVGLRSRRLFLVWTTWSGGERGEGDEQEVDRLEVLPTPKITGLDAVAFNSFSAGVLPEGSVRVSLVSAVYTEDQLSGYLPPTLGADYRDGFPATTSFFYELVEDGRGDALPVRQKYRLGSQLTRREGNVEWQFVLERIEEDTGRDGIPRFAPGKPYG